MFGAGSSSGAFGMPSTTAFSQSFGSSFYSSPAAASPFSSQPQTTPSPFFQQPPSTPSFGFSTPTPAMFPGGQLTTQMAPVAPLPFSLADRDIQAIVDAYKDEPGTTKYAFKHLLFSVTDPAFRVKPVGISDIMWAVAMSKLEGMESSDRERLWPQLVQGFKDLSNRMKLQDEALASDTGRLWTMQSNVKLLQRHFQADTLPWVQKLRQKEQGLQRRLLRVMRIIESLESKAFRVPLTKDETLLVEKLSALMRQMKGSGAELPRRVQNLLKMMRMNANWNGVGSSVFLHGSTKIDEQSLADMQDVLQQQTEALGRLGMVLKRDMRNMEIIMSEDTEMLEDGLADSNL